MSDKFGIPAVHWQKILSLFAPYKQIESVLLFGSRAMGNFRVGSDIDLCLNGDIDSDIIPKILNDYELFFLPWKLDLVIWNQIQNQDLKEHIQRVGIKV